jgi:hypothetical protein
MKLIYLFLLSTLMISCSSNNSSDQSEETSSDYPVVISSYLSLKDDLVRSDVEAANQSAAELLESAETAGLSGESLDLIRQMSHEKDLEEIRKTFEPLSRIIYNWAKESDLGGMKLYWQYCPMAMNDEGANWLSAESEIMNPYFGDQMLRCGNIEEEL